MKNKRIFLVIVGIILVSALIAFVLPHKTQLPGIKEPTKISTFDECAAQGNPILESYPPQCKTKDGKSFTQDIGNELEKQDQILIKTPRPNQVITSPLRVAGSARGGWFFEASSPMRLVDEKGNVLAESNIQAQGDWMTDDFVPYEGKLVFETNAKAGRLIIEKDNPSGLPENADELNIPVKFK